MFSINCMYILLDKTKLSTYLLKDNCVGHFVYTSKTRNFFNYYSASLNEKNVDKSKKDFTIKIDFGCINLTNDVPVKIDIGWIAKHA